MRGRRARGKQERRLRSSIEESGYGIWSSLALFGFVDGYFSTLIRYILLDSPYGNLVLCWIHFLTPVLSAKLKLRIAVYGQELHGRPSRLTTKQLTPPSFGRDAKLGVPCLDAACTVGLT